MRELLEDIKPFWELAKYLSLLLGIVCIAVIGWYGIDVFVSLLFSYFGSFTLLILIAIFVLYLSHKLD